MVEIRLDQEIRTEAGYADDPLPLFILRLAEHLSPEPLFPLGTRSIGDRGDLYEGRNARSSVLASGDRQRESVFETHVERASSRHVGVRRHSRTLGSNSDPTSTLSTRSIIQLDVLQTEHGRPTPGGNSPLLWANLIPTPPNPLLPVALILATLPTLSGSR